MIAYRSMTTIRKLFTTRPIAMEAAACVLYVLASPAWIAAQTDSTNAAPAQHAVITSLLQDLSRTRVPRQAAISPDGRIVAWVAPTTKTGERISLRALSGNDASTQLISIPTSDSKVERECSEGNIAWSPDSKKIAFTSDCATQGQPQIFVFDVNLSAGKTTNQVGTPHRMTAVKGFIHGVTWSPDGTRIGFLFVENASRPPGALAAMKPAVGVISAQTLAEIQRVAVIDVAANTEGMPQVTQVTPATLHIYDYAWSPNSKDLAYVAAPPPGEDNWWVAELYVQAIASGTPESILKPKMQIAQPQWSPDGKTIAYIGGLMSDYGETGGDIYVVSSSGGDARDLTPGRNASPAWLHWMDNRRLGFTEVVDGESRSSTIDPVTGTENQSDRMTFPATIGAGREHLSLSMSSEKGGTPVVAFIKSSFNEPPEVWAGPAHQLSQITHMNDSLHPDWGRSESITWNNEGFRVQGWLIYPRNYDPQKKYPLILWVHGGPANQMLSHWPTSTYNPPIAFSTLNYFMLMPNPRGSYGEGEAFTAANRKDFGYGDLRDLLAGVDVVTKKFPIDPARVGITGWSYGGFMTMFAVTQTNRFRAAVAGAGISDWKSYYGENSIDQWMIPYFGATVYDNPAVYAKSSAINYIKNAKTPMLIVVGDRDGECPAPQSFEMWHALNTMHVPVKLVVYPDEGHGFSNPSDERDVLERAIQWFDQYMPAKQSESRAAHQP